MRKQIFVKIRKTMAILLAVLFLISLIAWDVSAPSTKIKKTPAYKGEVKDKWGGCIEPRPYCDYGHAICVDGRWECTDTYIKKIPPEKYKIRRPWPPPPPDEIEPNYERNTLVTEQRIEKQQQ